MARRWPLALPALAMLTACLPPSSGTRTPVAPDLTRTGGSVTLVDELRVTRASFAEFPDQVMHVGAGDAPASVLAVSESELRRLDAGGARLQSVALKPKLWRPVLCRLDPQAPLTLVGLANDSVVIVGLDGVVRGRMPGWRYSDVHVADVTGDTSPEILLRYDDGVAIVGKNGAPAGSRKSPPHYARSLHYLYQITTIRPPGAAKDAVVFWMYRDRATGAVVQVRYADGTIVGQWTENPSNRVAAFSFPGEQPGLWSAVGDTVVRRTVTGEVTATYTAPGVGEYRYLRGAALSGGRRLFLASGGGYQWGSMVCVFSRDGRLEYQQALAGRSWALYAPSPDANVFYVGNGTTVWRYEVADPPG